MTYEEIIQKAVEANLNESVLSVTAEDLMVMRTHVTQWNLPADHFVVSNGVKDKLLAAEWFALVLDPPVKASDFEEGLIGTLFGMKVLLDTKNVMGPDSVAVVSEYGLADQPEHRCIFKCKMV